MVFSCVAYHIVALDTCAHQQILQRKSIPRANALALHQCGIAVLLLQLTVGIRDFLDQRVVQVQLFLIVAAGGHTRQDRFSSLQKQRQFGIQIVNMTVVIQLNFTAKHGVFVVPERRPGPEQLRIVRVKRSSNKPSFIMGNFLVCRKRNLAYGKILCHFQQPIINFQVDRTAGHFCQLSTAIPCHGYDIEIGAPAFITGQSIIQLSRRNLRIRSFLC